MGICVRTGSELFALRNRELCKLTCQLVTCRKHGLIKRQNTSFYQWSDENNYVWDQRGFNTWIKGEASTFLKKDDTRLHLNTVVTNVTYSDTGVTITDSKGGCVEAEYAICTFS